MLTYKTLPVGISVKSRHLFTHFAKCKSKNHEDNMTPAGKSLYCHLLGPSSFKSHISNSLYSNSPLVNYETILNKCVNLSNVKSKKHSSSWAFFMGCACVCTYLVTIFGEQLGLRPIHSRAAQ